MTRSALNSTLASVPICICGMHRSGTSMVARIFRECGMYLGSDEELIGPMPDNPDGFWEHKQIVRMNDEVLGTFGGAWDLPPIFETRWESALGLQKLKEKAKNIIKRLEGHEPWGWKDPRTSLTMPFWQSILPSLKAVICVRNPFEVAASLYKRGYSSRCFAINLWSIYNKSLLETLPSQDRIVTHYDSFFKNPEQEIKKLLRLTGLKLSDERILQVCSIIKRSLRHSEIHPIEEQLESLQEDTKLLYRALCEEAGLQIYSDVEPNKLSQCITQDKFTNKTNSPEFSEIEKPTFPTVRLVAFYLPQYHPIPENDQWWGKGFTEWTNVAKAKPLFPGHYQPHIPADLGFYDLRLEEVRKAQAEIAREFSIYGFCYYHYWFNGKLLLERPLQENLKSGQPSLPFCLCWANENWTRAWDGGSNQILIEQKYSDQDDRDHIASLCKIFNDSRYIRINGNPLFIVYRASLLPDPLKATNTWREEAKRFGIEGLYLCRVERFPEDMTDPQKIGFDAAIEFQPDGFNLGKPIQINGQYVYNYYDLIEAALSKKDPGYVRYPCVCPSWDNSARKKKNAVIFKDATPLLYEKWLKNTIKKQRKDVNGDKFVFINSWNEWGEGCHLEPDLKFERRFLEATKRAIIECNESAVKETVDNIYPNIQQDFMLAGKKDDGLIKDGDDFYCKVLKVENKNLATRKLMDSDGGKRTLSDKLQAKFNTEKMPSQVSIVIPVFNQLNYTRRCIETTIEVTDSVPYEFIIVDNGSSDGTREYLASLKDRVKIVTNQTNLGFAKACNQGAAAAASPYILFLNNDTEPQNGWLEPLVNILDSDQSVGAVGSKLLFPDRTIQHAGVLIIEDKKLPDPLVARHIYYNNADDFKEANKSRIYQALTAACLLIRMEAFKQVGGFDDKYWNGYEDIDLCFKLHKKWLIVYEPKSVLIHHESKSGPERFSKTCENINRLHKKWIGKVSPDAIIDKEGLFKWSVERRVGRYVRKTDDSCVPSNKLSNGRSKTVSIVILTFNQLKYTKECISSIEKYTPEPHEIIFVDNGSTDGTTKWLRRLTKANSKYSIIENKENLGFSKGCNQGIEASIGEYILLLNNDVVVTEDWLAGMLECLSSANDIGIVGPMTNKISGPQKVPVVDYKSTEDLADYARSFRKANRHRRITQRRVVGFCMLFKHQLIEKVGLLDESFGSGNFEDDDFCLRTSLAGYRNVIAGDVFIHHYGSRSFIGSKVNYGFSMSANRKIFAEKWVGRDVVQRFGKKIPIINAVVRADDFYSKGDIEKATVSMLEAIKYATTDSSLYFNLVEMLIDAKRYDDALSILQSVPQGDNDIRRLALLAYCEEGLGNNEKAQEYADQTLAISPVNIQALNTKGVIACKNKEKDIAESLFKKAIDLDPSWGESYTNMGSMKWAAGEFAEAIDLFERGFILCPTVTDVMTAYHSAVTDTEAFARAMPLFREARALHPNDKKLAFFLIAVLIQLHKYDLAMQEIEQVMVQFGVDEGILSAGLEIRKKNGPQNAKKLDNHRGALSVCMIVKNEEQNLAKCLQSVKPIAGEIIVVDTGSTDKTKKIAQVFGAKVYDFQWRNDFSEARNFSLSKASCEWIFILDADEIISSHDHAFFKIITKKNIVRPVAYEMTTRNYTNQVASRNWSANDGKYFEEETGRGWVPSLKVRLFTNRSGIKFSNAVHELVEPSLKELGIKISDCSLPVHHYGRLNQNKVITKGKEYYRIGKKKIEETNGDYNALKELAIQASEIGKYDEALKIWERVVKIDTQDAVAYMNAGHAYMMLDQYDKAFVYSKNALKIDPNCKEAALNYASCELIVGDVKKAISSLERLLQKEPNYPPAMARIAAAYYVDRQKEKGMNFLDELRRKGFNCASVLAEQSKAFISQGKIDEATLLLEAAIETKNINEDIYSLLSKCSVKREANGFVSDNESSINLV